MVVEGRTKNEVMSPKSLALAFSSKAINQNGNFFCGPHSPLIDREQTQDNHECTVSNMYDQ